MKRLTVDVWSDIACPWCYIGKRHLEQALAQFSHKDEVEVVWRAFELDPSAPKERVNEKSHAARIAQKYGMSLAMAEARLAQMTGVAKKDGLDFRFDRIRSGNTFDAHRLLHLAHERGKQDAVKEALLHGYMTEGEPIGSPEALTRIAVKAGLDEGEVTALLASDQYAEEVRAEEREAGALGITGVPFFVFGEKYAVSGAQPAEVLLAGLERAWQDVKEKPLETFAEGAVCGPEGCAEAS